jgi:PAS domain S-box-containing protein
MTESTPRAMREGVLDGLLRSAPLSVFAYDASGVCVFSEGAALLEMGLTPGELVGKNLWELYADRPHIVDRMKRALDGGTFLETDSVAERTYDTWYLPLSQPGAAEPFAVGVSVDVTGRVAAETAQRLYRAFVEAAPQFVALARLDGRVLYVNPGGRALAGIPDAVDVATTSISDYLTPEGLAASVEVEQPAVVRDGRWTGETTLRHWPTGEGIPVQVSSFLVLDPESGEPIALATVQSDIREVVAGREAVQREVAYQRGLLHHLHDAQESERQRIAADIHDDTVQVLAALNLRLQSLRRALEPLMPPERATEMAALDGTVREATERLRRLLVELDQPEVDDEGVRGALRKVADTGWSAGGPPTTVDVEVEAEPSPIVARALVRIAHEALTNVRKHARGASRADLELRQEAGRYVLRVVDDGPGLPADSRPPGSGHRGVRGMTERAESVGGTLTVAGRYGGGVVVEARLPHLLGHPDQLSVLPGSRQFLEQVMETISDCYCAIDSEWRYVYMNRAGYQLLRRDPADSVVGGVIWEEFDIAPDFAAAYHRARDEQVEVEITGYAPAWDVWIYNRILPTAGGLSIFARDVSDEMRKSAADRRHERQRLTARALSRAIAAGGRDDDATVLTKAVAAVVESWPVHGLRVTWPGGSVEAGTMVGPVRSVPLVVGGVEVGVAEVAGEVDEVDPDVLDLLAVRVAAGSAS